MIVYFDTSALAKWYLQENYSEIVTVYYNNAPVILTHQITYVEAIAAFAQASRDKRLEMSAYFKLKEEFVKDWQNYIQIPTDQRLLDIAANFAECYKLRAYDSMHLAAAFLAKQKIGEQELVFACFDHKLSKAASQLGLTLLDYQ